MLPDSHTSQLPHSAEVKKTPVSSSSGTTLDRDGAGRMPARLRLPRVKVGAGILRDIRARAPWYWSDWKDAWNYRVIPATALVFFAK